MEGVTACVFELDEEGAEETDGVSVDVLEVVGVAVLDPVPVAEEEVVGDPVVVTDVAGLGVIVGDEGIPSAYTLWSFEPM